MTELIKKINWQRILLNAVSIFVIVSASAWGNDFFLALKAGALAAALAFGRELQEAVKENSGKESKDNGTNLSNYLLF